MQITLNTSGDKLVMNLRGRFEFSVRRQFDLAIRDVLASPCRHLQVSLRDVEYMDSSALGMLLVMRDKLSAVGKKAVLVDAQGMVKKIIEVANFQKIFETT